MSSLFHYLDLETISICNRICPTCLRNSHPNREILQSWFEPHYLPIKVIREALDQCAELGFAGGVCLSHFNEPLMDERLPEIARMAKSYNQFFLFLNTNGDYLTERIIGELDGVLDRIIVTLYMDEPVKSRRKEWIESTFHKTEVHTITMSKHLTTHYSPNSDLKGLIEKHKDNDCKEPQMRVIINHKQQYLLCCEDVIGNFDLGTFPEISIHDHWFGDKMTKIRDTLNHKGGRLQYSYCSICPKS